MIKGKTETRVININTDCCDHSNSNIYRIGYLVFPFLKVAICDSCNECQGIFNDFWLPLFNFLFNITNGKIKLQGLWQTDESILKEKGVAR